MENKPISYQIIGPKGERSFKKI